MPAILDGGVALFFHFVDSYTANNSATQDLFVMTPKDVGLDQTDVYTIYIHMLSCMYTYTHVYIGLNLYIYMYVCIHTHMCCVVTPAGGMVFEL